MVLSENKVLYEAKRLSKWQWYQQRLQNVSFYTYDTYKNVGKQTLTEGCMTIREANDKVGDEVFWILDGGGKCKTIERAK